MQYGERWREIRKHMHTILNPNKMDGFAKHQDIESKQLLWDYLQRPDTWFKSNQRYSYAVVVSVVCGTRMVSDQHLSALVAQTQEFVGQLTSGGHLADGFPFLANLPKSLQWWRKDGRRLFEQARR
jgi:hypothetical protein